MLSACLVVGCTGIVLGTNDVSSDEQVASGGFGGVMATSTQPSSTASAPNAPELGGAGGDSWELAAGAGRGGDANAGATAGEGGEGSSLGGMAAAGEGGQAPVGGRDTGSSGEGGVSGSSEEPGGSGGSTPGPLQPGDPLRGSTLVRQSNCYRCHGADLAGRSFYPNITPDLATGVGAWSDAQLALAIRAGVNEKNEVLCAAMPIYSGLSAQGLLDMVAFLRSVPPQSNAITLACPGHDP